MQTLNYNFFIKFEGGGVLKKYILAHDLGTTGNKATLFDTDGKMVASEVFSYSTHYFNNNWVEQDANNWWQAVCVTTKNLLCGIDAKNVVVVSFSGQMMGCLCVDYEGNPLRPSIIWADSRAKQQSEEIESKISMQDYYRITGHRNTASYGIQKLMWVRDNEPEIFKRTYKTLNSKDFVILRLTGKFYTDYSDGISNCCFDLVNLKWSDELLSIAGIDKDKMPEVVPSTFVAGEVTEKASAECGLAPGTLVVMGSGDGVAANIGAGSISPGNTYCSIGTSAWISTTTVKPLYDEEMRTVTWPHAIPGLYALNGTMQFAGGAYNWLKNTICTMETHQAELCGGSPYDYMNEQAGQSAPGAGGVIFLPYLIGERAPRWDSNAKGAFLGLKPETTRGDIIRSVMEGATFNLSIILEILRKVLPINEIMVLGGGAKGEVWQQMMADIFDAKVTVPAVLEAANSMGAAVIGGVGAGLFKDFSAIEKFIELKTSILPNTQTAKVYDHAKRQFDACYYALKGINF